MASVMNQLSGSTSSTATGKKPSLFLYGAVALIALFKDLLDLIAIGSIPFIGTLVTLCFSSLIFMLLLLFDRSGGRGNRQMAQGVVMMFATLVEGLGFGLNFLPIETLTVGILYVISYRAWQKVEKTEIASSKGKSRKMRLQQIQLARAMARQEQAVEQLASSEQVEQVTPQRAPQVVTPMAEHTATSRPGRITVRRGKVVSSGPLVVSSRAPLSTPVVAIRRSADRAPQSKSAVVGAGLSSANEATYRIQAAGNRMAQASSLTRPPATNPSRYGGVRRAA